MNLLCWTMAPSIKITRKWEVFAGRNKFYCDGFLMSAPNTGVFYLTLFLITGTSILFFAFDCPYLTLQITPAIPAVGALLYFFTMGSLLRTTFTDPGVIPRASQDEAAYIEKQIEVPNSLNSPTYRPPPRTKEVLVKGQTVKLKYCFTCKIFRPPRASHCSLCDNCVDRFDHHCPWVGNCVGKRNYRFFYMFIVSLAFLAVFIFSCSLTHLILLAKDSNQEFIEVIRQAPFSVVVTFICFFSIWSVIGLAGFHTYLTTSDQTTNEDIKGSFTSKGAQHPVNPYSHGNVCLNCFYILCGPMTPSLIDRRGIVTDEYRIQMQPPERFNNAIQSPQFLTQPKINSDHMNKSKYFDIELDPNLINSGVYRQRSYENLEKGHSNSVARLVDNELPVSTLNSPIDENVSPVDFDDDAAVPPALLLGNLNNMSGSYTNLFREKCGDDSDDTENNAQIKSSAEQMSEHNISENVYSNIPQQIASSFPNIAAANIATAQHGDNADAERFDPNQHVYSNLIANVSQSSILANESIAHLDMDPSVASSTMICDDLDLDDPVIVATSFGIVQQQQQTPKNTQPIATTITTTQPKSPKICSLDLDGTKTAQNVQLDRKNGLPQVTIVGDSLAGPSTTSNSSSSTATATANNNNNNTSLTTTSTKSTNNTFCSPSRLRLLHDTTMIDTALDLDSLDGSSIGNNSQACLVKTAIV